MEDNTPLLKQKQTEGKVNKEDKPKSKRSIRSEAQLQALAKGREKRFENLHKTKKDLEELKQIREQQKQQQEELEPKKTHKGTGVSKKEVVVEESDDDSEDVPIIIKKKKTHKGTGVSKKPKVIYVESESEESDEEQVVKTKFKELKNKKYNKKPTPSSVVEPKKVIQQATNIDYSKFFC